MKLNKEQIEFLDKYTDGVWTLNEKTGLVDIGGCFDCASEKLTDFKGVRFGVVTGNFICSNNSLTSLEGSPQKVGVGFDCSSNKLTSLEGAPQKVGWGFYCSRNKLTSLVGAPQEVGGGFFWCGDNPISEKTLELVWETMCEKKIDYWFALSILKSEIKSRDWKKMSRGLDDRLSKDTQKGISMLGRFGHFN